MADLGMAVGSSRYSNKNVSTLKWLNGFNYSVVFFKNKTENKTNLQVNQFFKYESCA